jgi:hypothetical protein
MESVLFMDSIDLSIYESMNGWIHGSMDSMNSMVSMDSIESIDFIDSINFTHSKDSMESMDSMDSMYFMGSKDSMDGCINGWSDLWIDASTDLRMDGLLDL